VEVNDVESENFRLWWVCTIQGGIMWGDKEVLATQPAVSNPPGTSPSKPVPSSWKETRTSIDPVRPLTTLSDRAGARLGASLQVKGEISGNEDLHIDGSAEGLINFKDGKITVGSSAKVTADVVAREVVVYGSVKGNLRARDRIEIKKDGSVVGDLTTARIMIEDGAYFKGSIEIDRGNEKETDHDRSAFARAANPISAHAPTHVPKTSS